MKNLKKRIMEKMLRNLKMELILKDNIKKIIILKRYKKTNKMLIKICK